MSLQKNHRPGKWRRILDFSTPVGHSVIDSIPKDPHFLKYMTVDNAIQCLVVGSWGFYSKVIYSWKAANRNIPIYPDDRFLLGMKSRDHYYSTWILLYNLVSETVEWMIEHNCAVCPLFHYFDGCLTMCPANSSLLIMKSYVTLHLLCLTASVFRFLLKNMLKGRSMILAFFKTLLDSVQQSARLIPVKVDRIPRLLHSWARKKT